MSIAPLICWDKVAIIGSRSFADYPAFCEALAPFNDNQCHGWPWTEVISGGARGVDTLAARWATEHNLKLTELRADWDRHGKRAGFLRNADIIAGANMVIAFWDGSSKGTRHSIGLAHKARKPTFIIYV
jgi:hypothetical protein